MLTVWQEHRVGFHLGYTDLHPVDWGVSGLGDSAWVTITGDPTATPFLVHGESVGSQDGLLGRVEQAYAKLNSDTIEDSLFVSQAGTVQLRGDELLKRRALYRSLVKDMSSVTGIPYLALGKGPSYDY